MKHSAGTWLSVLNHFPSSDPASLDQVSHWKPDPPAVVADRTLSHTMPLCGARVNGLNRYLKSFRNKRKKHRKSSAKRAREKGRYRKK